MTEDSTGLVVPTIHRNGTSRDVLMQGLLDAAERLQLAISALSLTVPNGRDYYMRDTSDFRRAMSQHASRVTRLATVYAELMEIAQAIDT